VEAALGSPKALLERFGLRPKRSFGQNFLADANMAARIAELATPSPDCQVVEIGAGLGALTALLLTRSERVVAIERDRDLVPALTEIFAEPIAAGRLELLEADAKQVDFLECLPEATPASRIIAGNLPYQITGPLLERIVGVGRSIRRGVFLVQKEVADRLAAAPDTENYGALTVFVQAQFHVERAFIVRRGAFYPQPGVDSAVVVLNPHPVPVSEETSAFRRVVKSAFAARRKTLRNAWRSLGTSEAVAQAAQTAGIDLDKRGETLSVAQFAAFAVGLPVPASGVDEDDGEET
jgi:16S rRNA (adenine1518-N6/adenine1519-N6)-dimethyltransferase